MDFEVLNFVFSTTKQPHIKKLPSALYTKYQNKTKTNKPKRKRIADITLEFLQMSHPIPTFPEKIDLDFLSPFSNEKTATERKI